MNSSPAGDGCTIPAHMIHRQVDWSIRYHSRTAIDRRLAVARAVLWDIPLRTGCEVSRWPE